MEKPKIQVTGARSNNLKNIDVEIPHRSLAVVTGLSGSGKSSLAFDTIYAEGQRRYLETFSAYARNFLGGLQRPDVDRITGLSPVISIEQKTTNRNPRSTVGTVTEVYDYLRLLFARAGEAYSYLSGEKMVRFTEEQIVSLIMKDYDGQRIFVLAPLVRNRKGHYRELFESIRRKGYLTVRVDGVIREIKPGMKLDRYRNHDIEVVIEKLVVNEKYERRLADSVELAMKQGDGIMMILSQPKETIPGRPEPGVLRHYSRRLMCPVTGIAYREPAPHNFSFNSPQGFCPRCKGLGYVSLVSEDKVLPDRSLSVKQGAIAPLGPFKNTLIFRQISALLAKYDYSVDTPIDQMSDDVIDELLNGSDERIKVQITGINSEADAVFMEYDGICKYVRSLQQQPDLSAAEQKWVDQFAVTDVCPVCHGARLNREALHFRIDGKNIYELASMDLSDLHKWSVDVIDRLGERQRSIAQEILKEIRTRLEFMLEVGLDYLSLNRPSESLSGGEEQRIRLATQIGSKLVNVLYILDEPSIGLHQRDNCRLIESLCTLRDAGNTVLVVEHDRDMMMAADWIIDLGPLAGRKGGNVVFQGTPAELMEKDTLTARYLRGQEDTCEKGVVPRQGNGLSITLHGCCGNNLKNVDVEFPLGKLVCVTGVSGSGKSTLVNETLQPVLSQHFYRSLKQPLQYSSVEGIDNIDKVVCVDQSPLGRSPRSNPATYTGVFSDIRQLFVELPESRMRAYKPGRFSFNVSSGRCEACGGNGYRTIEMNFLPDVMVPCEQCGGKRYNRETLEVRYKGKSIADVLDMTINMAVEFFENVPAILNKIKVLQDVGLGYLKLGQPSTTISGGESQRVKLASELSKRDTGRTLYILDEPTTGLHFEDIRVLMNVLNRLVDKGNTVIVIEHNMDVIKQADWIIDVGPEGGRNGGQIVVCGTPEQVAQSGIGYTSPFLKEEMKRSKML
ncbi:MAG: excinuclease ABC subunit UvrA [Bacteroidaceae bacterium]|nr:excinuclease ABC subunit UvrA [Bacteroidaceae bacterium]